MTQIMNRIKSAFKTITSNDETEKSEDKSMPFSITGTEEKVAKKIKKNEYEGFANGFPEWTLEPPQVAVRRKK
ncbi:high mobility group protein 1 [Fusobacterium polymorphum]|uniref:high mobility group protein 1 n=1 Tax=Fusobacterium nucleatum subsp. polymorphum TaxID=76857 RepID=UPI003008113B